MRIAREFLRRPTAVFGLIVVLMVVIGALAAPLIAPYAPDEQLFDGLTLEGAPIGPDAAFLLGTDTLGRDLLTRLLFGARTSLIIGVVASASACWPATCAARPAMP
jgi:peptide/nickel transport system permease protein